MSFFANKFTKSLRKCLILVAGFALFSQLSSCNNPDYFYEEIETLFGSHPGAARPNKILTATVEIEHVTGQLTPTTGVRNP